MIINELLIIIIYKWYPHATPWLLNKLLDKPSIYRLIHTKHVTVVFVDFSIFSDVSKYSLVFRILSDVRYVTHLMVANDELEKNKMKCTKMTG